LTDLAVIAVKPRNDYGLKMMNDSKDESFGNLLRTWRKKRRFSQLELALDADISSKHLSFLEGGRAQPSREMVLRLSGPLKLSMRNQNSLLTAAGFAVQHPQRQLDDPQLEHAVRAVQLVLSGLEPYPCIALDKHWNIKSSNRAVRHLLVDVPQEMLQTPINVLRLSLHPLGLRKQIVNLEEWSSHLIHLLQEKIDSDDDPYLKELRNELLSFNGIDPQPKRRKRVEALLGERNTAFIPLQLRVRGCLLTLVSTTMVFGTPTDITMSELLIESLLPANEETADWFRRLDDRGADRP
jgi:transcriptional regulator with XRE-family HTH domain